MTKLRKVFLIISVFVFLVDRLLKIFISETTEIFLIPKILSLELYKNYGAAFGLKIPVFLIVIFSIAILVLIVIFIKKDIRKKIPHWVLLFLVLGAVSNIFDRIHYGYVVDTFNFLNISFFNLADGMIIVGLLLIFYYYRKN
ncbi:MAG: signal peptidase II [Patescibacteria group bacterium]|nr:signal peptidase II [Patescibacteria group bacterium]